MREISEKIQQEAAEVAEPRQRKSAHCLTMTSRDECDKRKRRQGMRPWHATAHARCFWYHIPNHSLISPVIYAMGKPHYKWSQVHTIDERLDAYKIRLTSGWAASIEAAASKSILLSEIVGDFVLSLRFIEATAMLPFLMVTQLKGFVDGYTRYSGAGVAEKTAGLITARLVRQLDICDKELRDQIAAKCLEISVQVRATRKTPPFSIEEIWRQYCSTPKFRFALTGSQQISFVAVHNAYDDFLMRCLRVALALPKYRKRKDKDFATDFVTAFDGALYTTCWDNREFQLFRAARHSFAHCGGRETEELQRLSHPFRVEKGVLQFGPHHAAKAFRIVEKSADAMVAAASSHPSFLPAGGLDKLSRK